MKEEIKQVIMLLTNHEKLTSMPPTSSFLIFLFKWPIFFVLKVIWIPFIQQKFSFYYVQGTILDAGGTMLEQDSIATSIELTVQ